VKNQFNLNHFSINVKFPCYQIYFDAVNFFNVSSVVIADSHNLRRASTMVEEEFYFSRFLLRWSVRKMEESTKHEKNNILKTTEDLKCEYG
jgi:hypothetical protein